MPLMIWTNAINGINYNGHMVFFDIGKVMGEVIGKKQKCNSLN